MVDPALGEGYGGRGDTGGSQPPQILRRGVQCPRRPESGLLVGPERRYGGSEGREVGGEARVGAGGPDDRIWGFREAVTPEDSLC